MKIASTSMLALAIAGLAGHAVASPELAKAKSCTACHAASSKLVGPSFKDIAAKYANDNAAPDALAKKIKLGSKGAWGPIAMPPNPQLSNEDASSLARWILTQR